MSDVFLHSKMSEERHQESLHDKVIMLQLTNLLAQQHLITPDEKARLTIRIKGGNIP